jgi:hypothetical protein
MQMRMYMEMKLGNGDEMAGRDDEWNWRSG